MKSHLTTDFFTQNRNRFRKLFKPDALIIIPAHSKLQKNADEHYPFRQDSSFWYLTGLDAPDAALVIDNEQQTEFLILMHQTKLPDQWETTISLEEAKAASGVADVKGMREGLQTLREAVVRRESVDTLLPPTRRFKTVYGLSPNPARSLWVQRMKRMNSNVTFNNVRDEVKQLRIIKQPEEILSIKQAIAITEQGLQDVQAALPDLKYEYEVKAVLHAAFTRQNAELAFDSIIASGAHAATVHYYKSDGALHKSDMLLIDCGAMVDYYAADISRIFKPINGMTKRQEEISDAVLRACEFARSIMKPGIKHRDYEKQVREFVGEELVRLGIIKRVTKEVLHRYFPSMTSHHLGLDVHDIANYDEVFEPGMVLTIEPGIYVPEEGIGVRYEDDLLITDTGNEILSNRLPLKPI